MGVRVWRNGRVVMQRGMVRARVPPAASILDENGKTIGSMYDPVPHNPDKPRPLGYGDIYEDPETKLTFRVVSAEVLHKDGGWMTADFWLRHYVLTFTQFRHLVREGMMDCAMAHGSGMRRYRCLNPERAAARSRELRGLKPLRKRSAP